MIGNGVVVDPGVLLEELAGLEARGVDTSGLLISADAHLIMPYHVAMDKVTERFLGKAKIGTTGRGIGPAYQDKVARIGVRVADVLDEKILHQKVEAALELKNQMLVKVYNRRALDVDEVVDTVLAHGRRFADRIADTRLLLNEALERGETILLEGSQGTLLDVDHGTYPYVTSSNPTAGGAAVGSGIGPTRITRVIGILKAYTTRVGLRPVPDRAARRDGRAAAQGRRRGRGDHRPPAPLRLVRRRDRPLRRAGQRDHRLLPDQAGRALRAGDGAGLRGLRGRRPPGRRDADDPDRRAPRRAGVRGAARLVRGHLGAAASSTSCRPPRGRTYTASRS